VVCNLISIPMSMFGGFLVNLDDTKAYLSWIQHISYLKHGFFGGLRVLFRKPFQPMKTNKKYLMHTFRKSRNLLYSRRTYRWINGKFFLFHFFILTIMF
jgi:hypothetical protein